jgi:hypothetical protein
MTMQSSHNIRKFNPFRGEKVDNRNSLQSISRKHSKAKQSSGTRIIETSSGKETSFFRNNTSSEQIAPTIFEQNTGSSQKGPEAPRDL